jgi:hypothetical protein
MIQRRAGAAGIATKIGNHTFRATGIAAYPVLKVFRRYASFRVALGFAQPPRQFARIPEQRFQLPAEGRYVWA